MPLFEGLNYLKQVMPLPPQKKTYTNDKYTETKEAPNKKLSHMLVLIPDNSGT